MRITTTTADGKRVSWRPEELLEDLQHQVLDSKLTREGAIEQMKFAFPGMSVAWYADIIEWWFPEPP